MLTIGIDLGSTTVKYALLSESGVLLSHDYVRHGSAVKQTLEKVLRALALRTHDAPVHVLFSGSGALGLADALGAGFVLLDAAKRHERGWFWQALALPMGAGLLLLTCYWGEMAHPYYALAFAGLCAPGLIPLAWLANRAQRRGMFAWTLPMAGVLAVTPTCMGLCRAVPLMQVRKADMPQTVFAEIMNREGNPTLLDITSLDQGFYLAAGIVPNCRYFADNNLQTKEKKEAIASYLAEGKTQFVVTRYADPGERYALIAEADGVFDLNDMRHYKLYERIEENDGGLP